MFQEQLKEVSEDEEERLYNEKYMDIIIFTLGGESYACPILHIQEIVEPFELKEVPQTNGCFKGVFNLRGRIIGAVDLREKLYPEVEKLCDSSAFIICEGKMGYTALIIDKVKKVMTVERESIVLNLDINNVVPPKFIQGFINHEGSIVTIISLKDFIDNIDINQINEVYLEAV